MSLITAQVLGPPVLRIDGAEAPAPMRWRKNLGLCILLWSSPARRIPRDVALTMLWGSRGEHEARHSLNEALRVIRRHLGAEAIDSDRDLLHWLAPISIDTDEFAAMETGDPQGAAQLIRGAWCEGLAIPDAGEFEQWLDDERRRWRHRLVGVLASATDRAGDLGQVQLARDWSEAAQRLDPLSEVAARARIRSMALAGDRSGALTEADAFAARLHEELGVPLDGETALLLRRVAAMRQPQPAHLREDAVRVVPVVGRAQAMLRLLGAARRCQHDSSAALLLIEGEAGSGCTRLLDEVGIRAGLDGFNVLTVRAVPGDASQEGAGLKAIAGAGIARLPGAAALGTEPLGVLTTVSPEWAERYPSGPASSTMSLDDALVAAIRAIAVERPLMLGIDDVGCFDSQSLQQLPRILRGIGALPVTMVLVTRLGDARSEIDALRAQVGPPHAGIRVTVDPLPESDLLDAVRAVLPDWSPASQDRLTRRLVAESAGLPAVAVGILEAVVRGLALEELDGTWPAPDRTMDATLPSPMPGSLTAAVRMRFHRLGERERELLHLLAVEGSAIRADRLCGLTQQATELVNRQLDALEWERWVVADSRGYRYRARAVGTLVAAELLTPGQRRRIEARLAAN